MRKFASKRLFDFYTALLYNLVCFIAVGGLLRSRKPYQRKRRERLNDEITSAEVRLGERVDGLTDVVPTLKALQKAKELDLDLVEIAAHADPPVCRDH